MKGIGARLRDRAVAALQERLLGAAPVSALPAAPVAGRLGPPAFLAPNVAPDLAEGDRESHRLTAFAHWSARHALGETGAAERAVEVLAAWLRADRPGAGAAWDHPTDLTVRLVHLAAGFAWLGNAAPAELVASAAGSAGWHVRHLICRLPLDTDSGHQRVAHHVGLLVAGLTFPALPEARQAWSEASSRLGAGVDALTFADGSDRSGAPAFLAQSLWLVAIAHAVARTNGVSLPARAMSSWSRGVAFLDRLANENGTIPALGEAPFGEILPLPGVPLPGSLRTLSNRWGLDACDPAPLDARACWFLRREPEAGPRAPGARHWLAWSFPQDGLAVAVMTVRNEPLRVVVAAGSQSGGRLAHDAPLQVLVDVGARRLLADPGSGQPLREHHDGLRVRGAAPSRVQLRVARVDGKKARMEGSASLGGGAVWCRDVLLNQQRVRVTDRLEGRGGTVDLRWTIGPDWSIEGEGGKYVLRGGPHTVAVDLPAALTWCLEGGSALVGTGELAAGAEILSSFEVK